MVFVLDSNFSLFCLLFKVTIFAFVPRLRCHPEVTSDQTVPDESHLWSDHPRRKWPLIRLMCAQNTVCAECALKMVSDHTIPIRNWSLIRPKSDHGPDDCALQMNSDHTIPRPKVTPDQTIPIRNWPLIRPFPSESDPWSDYSHPEPKPRHCNYGLGTHRVRWTSDDQRSLPDGTSTWVVYTLKKQKLFWKQKWGSLVWGFISLGVYFLSKICGVFFRWGLFSRLD